MQSVLAAARHAQFGYGSGPELRCMLSGGPATELPAHSEYCGSRTERCDSCFNFVQLRHLEQHKFSSCATNLDGFPRLPTSPPLMMSQESSSYDGSSDASPPDQLITDLGVEDKTALTIGLLTERLRDKIDHQAVIAVCQRAQQRTVQQA